jgi:hypothetical protein
MSKAKRAEQLIRLAYKLETIANELKAEGRDSEGSGVRAAASQIGNIGRGLRS